jgi:gas vesicle protein
MKNNNTEQEVQHHASNLTSALLGFLIGGLAGASAALLFAPQSGRETREQIQQKTVELRDRTTETMGDAVSQVKSKAYEMQGKAEEFQQKSQGKIAEKLDRVSAAVEAGKAAYASESEKNTMGENENPAI